MNPIKFDILILCKEEDLNKVKFLIESIENNIEGYEKIYLITPQKVNVEKIVNFTDFEVLEEKYKDGVKYRPSWIFQQYIKLFQDVTRNDYYLVLDSDIYINKKIDIFSEQKPNFFIGSDQFHQPYFTFSEKFGISKVLDKSFISEIMIFNKKRIREFLQMKNLTIKSFLENSNTIIKEGCYISEFEFYGNMILTHYRSDYNLKKINISLNGKHKEWRDDEIESLIESNKKYDIISYHTWK